MLYRVLQIFAFLLGVLLAPGVFASQEPESIPEIPLSKISEGLPNGYRLVTTGIVTEISDDEIDADYKRLTLHDGDKVMPVFVYTATCPLPPDLMEHKIRIECDYLFITEGGRKFSGPYLCAKTIVVLHSSTEDPFAAPPLDTRLYQTPKDLHRMGRRTISGQVLAIWKNTRILMRTDGGEDILVFCLESVVPPPCGTMITVSGFPDTDRFHLIVNRAMLRIDDRPPFPEESARPTIATEIVSNRNGRITVDIHLHSKLISITGVVRSLPPPDSPLRLAHVESQGLDVPVDFSAAPNALASVEIGYTVHLTGRCLITAEDWSPFDSYPQLGQASLLLRKAGDVEIVSRLPWWTPKRLMVVIGVLLAIIGVFAVRIHLRKEMERLKLSERTRLAVELHDSLSQALAGLACQIAATGEDLKNGLPTTKDKLASADRMLKSCRTELKNCLFDLRSDTLNEKDLSLAVRRTIENLLPYASISIRFNARRSLLDDSTVHAVLAIIRELVANAIHHGAAASIKIAGSIDNSRLLFSVSDDGIGFVPSRAPGVSNGHFGLNGIRERVGTMKGTFKIDSSPDKGTYVKILLPVRLK